MKTSSTSRLRTEAQLRGCVRNSSLSAHTFTRKFLKAESWRSEGRQGGAGGRRGDYLDAWTVWHIGCRSHRVLNQGEIFLSGSNGGGIVFLNPFSQWISTHWCFANAAECCPLAWTASPSESRRAGETSDERPNLAGARVPEGTAKPSRPIGDDWGRTTTSTSPRRNCSSTIIIFTPYSHFSTLLFRSKKLGVCRYCRSAPIQPLLPPGKTVSPHP